MFASMIETARNSPFKFPGTKVQCEAGAEKALVPSRNIAAADANSEYACEFGSPHFFALCGLGGILSCGKVTCSFKDLDSSHMCLHFPPRYYAYHGCAIRFGEMSSPSR